MRRVQYCRYLEAEVHEEGNLFPQKQSSSVRGIPGPWSRTSALIWLQEFPKHQLLYCFHSKEKVVLIEEMVIRQGKVVCISGMYPYMYCTYRNMSWDVPIGELMDTLILIDEKMQPGTVLSINKKMQRDVFYWSEDATRFSIDQKMLPGNYNWSEDTARWVNDQVGWRHLFSNDFYIAAPCFIMIISCMPLAFQWASAAAPCFIIIISCGPLLSK
jgi:hypothetical protein